ncbi:phosphoglucosamine mutase [Palleniella muris]|uniref:Phosphoglucosamine mutase n=1 Tax=Palleniella muris TaxID=3038145 RepID=A0AC61QPF7_9BACT|nr:phosphoglucosamine mutase [Palleniella muris]TGX81737.1 phosphoglucosamine mutase [Palleniella muris]
MSLIKSISGIRGTIGGPAGDTLNPLDIVKFTSAYATLIRKSTQEEERYTPTNRIVVGRDARISGEMVKNVVCGTLMGMGFDVINIGLASTPTTELAVTMAHADGGIIITASHNPRHWNALKLLNRHGEFLNATEGNEVLSIAEAEAFDYADVDNLGQYTEENFDERHIQSVLDLKLVDVEAVKKAKFNVCVDSINSVGGIILPKLLERLGVGYTFLNKEADGDFRHNPEPLEKNLTGIMDEMKTGKYDLGIVVDPDVDRLAFICEDGKMFGEEYTLVSVADYILSEMEKNAKEEGTSLPALNTVSNLSSTRALRDVTEAHGGTYTAAAVGEVNVTTKMKEVGAVIGGEGNGGVIYPDSHYGRDALTGIGLFLSSLAHKGISASALRATFPEYFIAKNRIDLTPDTDVDAILVQVKEKYAKEKDVQVNDIDGVKLDFPDKWVHLRKSNTEPIIRVYSEAHSMEEADQLGKSIMDIVYAMV